jgi:hypothetical protein
MAKYEPLRTFLTGRSEAEIPLSFQEIERIIGAKLPPVARKHRAWWSNNPSNSVITHAWLEAGFKTERVDMGSEKLVFRREASDFSNPGGDPHPTGGPGSLIERLRAALGGTVTFAPGFDPTEPTGEVWDAER